MTKTALKSVRRAAKTLAKNARAKPEKDPAPTARPGTKIQTLIALLDRPEGAIAEELMAAVGWQKHSIQGFIAGTVKKKMGLTVLSEKQKNGARLYRILKDGK